MPNRRRSAHALVVSPRFRQLNKTPTCRLESLEHRTFMSVSQDGGGWTVVGPSADSRVIYVSSSAGNDANSGMSDSSAVKSVGKGRSLLRNGMPDHLLLKRGDVWHESLSGSTWGLSGRDADEPMLVGTYGDASAARPLLKTGANKAFDLNGSAVH